MVEGRERRAQRRRQARPASGRSRQARRSARRTRARSPQRTSCVDLERGAAERGEARLDDELVVEPRRRQIIGAAAPHGEDATDRPAQLLLLEAHDGAASRCAPARRISDSWRSRRSRRHRCPRNRRARRSDARRRAAGAIDDGSSVMAPSRRRSPTRIVRQQVELRRARRGDSAGRDRYRRDRSASGRAACAAAAPAG